MSAHFCSASYGFPEEQSSCVTALCQVCGKYSRSCSYDQVSYFPPFIINSVNNRAFHEGLLEERFNYFRSFGSSRFHFVMLALHFLSFFSFFNNGLLHWFLKYQVYYTRLIFFTQWHKNILHFYFKNLTKHSFKQSQNVV